MILTGTLGTWFLPDTSGVGGRDGISLSESLQEPVLANIPQVQIYVSAGRKPDLLDSCSGCTGHFEPTTLHHNQSTNRRNSDETQSDGVYGFHLVQCLEHILAKPDLHYGVLRVLAYVHLP